jgi:hypothetical protein
MRRKRKQTDIKTGGKMKGTKKAESIKRIKKLNRGRSGNKQKKQK